MKRSKYSVASKARWAKVPKEERSRIMRALALDRHAKMTKKQERINSLKMIEAKKKKNAK